MNVFDWQVQDWIDQEVESFSHTLHLLPRHLQRSFQTSLFAFYLTCFTLIITVFGVALLTSTR